MANEAVERDDGHRTTTAMENLPSLRVLIVDDQEINLLVARRALQHFGHTPVTARNGREALEKWEEDKFDLILMDINMPVMDGITTTQEIRERERATGSRIPIIALTSLPLHEVGEQVMSKGFDDYVAKPLDFELLYGALKRCLAPA